MNWTRKFHEPFVYAALGIALTAGSGLGVYLVIARALALPLGGWYGALVQAHGHAQLFGWVGLFVVGAGLFFLPKLRGAELKRLNRIPAAFALLVTGIVLRSVVQPASGFMGTNLLFRLLFLLSALLELGGFVIVLSMLVGAIRAGKPLSANAPMYPLEPFVQIALISFTGAFLFNLFGTWNLFTQGRSILAPRYDQLIIQLMVYGTILPMTFVFAVRTLPLYLRLVVPTRGVWRSLAIFYFVGLTLRLVPNILVIADDVLILTGRVLRANFLYVLLADALAVFGALVLNLCLLLGIWQLHLWQRRGERSDRGEYGRFYLLIYSAYAWLGAAILLDILRTLPFVNGQIIVPQDAARHALMLGFITLLIFGMAVRMLPGFSGKRAVALPQLVTWMFLLGNAAAVLRVAPLFFASDLPVSGLLAVSGLVGWGAVVLLAIVLTQTFHAPLPTEK